MLRWAAWEKKNRLNGGQGGVWVDVKWESGKKGDFEVRLVVGGEREGDR